MNTQSLSFAILQFLDRRIHLRENKPSNDEQERKDDKIPSHRTHPKKDTVKMYALSNQAHPRPNDADRLQSSEQRSPAANAGAAFNTTGDVAAATDSRPASREDGTEKDRHHSSKKNKKSHSEHRKDELNERKTKISGLDEPKSSMPVAAAEPPPVASQFHRYASMSTIKTGSGGVKTRKISAAETSYEASKMPPRQTTSSCAVAALLTQGEKEDSHHSFQGRQTRNTGKANEALETGATTIGAVAVPGPMMEETRRHFNSLVSESPHQPNQATPATTIQDGPIEATRVEDSDTDIEAQIQSRMQNQAKDIADMVHQQLMTNAAVPVNVHPSDSNNINDNESIGEGRKKQNYIIAGIAIAIIVAAVATAVGVSTVSNKQNAEQPNSPPAAPPSPTSAPSGGAAAASFQSILEPLSGEALNDTNSPQGQAFSWIVNGDPAQLSVEDTPHETIKTRYVAALLYFAFQGTNWLQQFNFLSADNVCMWNQIGTDDRAYGIECGVQGSIETLRLRKYLLPINAFLNIS